MMGCVIALDSYISENKEAVEKFLEEYEASIKFALENPNEAAASCAKYGISPSEAIAKKSLPTCNLCYVTGETMKESVKAYYSVLFNADPKSVGGALPADDFYYNAE
jgi:NitT/TauT family transport system substrate-binding protein